MREVVVMTLDECDALFARIRAETSAQLLVPLFRQLLMADYSVIRIDMNRGSIFWRARPCSPQGYDNIREVTYPPPHLAALNRLSDEEQPRFYASTRKETALAEQAECRAGEHYHLIGSWVQQDKHIRVLVLGEQHHVFKMGYWRLLGVDPGGTLARQLNALPRERGLRAIYIDAFLGSILSDPSARQSGYIHSRALLSAITQEHTVDAVFFPSVKDAWGINIVITPEAVERRMTYCGSKVVRVERCREFGVLETTTLRQAQAIRTNGDFEWLEDLQSDREIIFGMTKEEFEFSRAHQTNPNALLDLKAFVRSRGRSERS
jgi:RES domain